MTLRDLHAPVYLAIGESDLSSAARPGAHVDARLCAAVLTGTSYDASLAVRNESRGWNLLGEEKAYGVSTRRIPYRPWMSQPLPPLLATMPDEPAVLVLATTLEDTKGTVLQRNFTTFVVDGAPPDTVRLADGRRARIARVPATAVRDSHWSLKQWTV